MSQREPRHCQCTSRLYSTSNRTGKKSLAKWTLIRTSGIRRSRLWHEEVSLMKKALITGITGQDGSYLAELLLEKGYEVHGIIRRASTFNTGRIDHLYQDPHINGVKLFLHYGDIADSTNLIRLLYRLEPDEIYHLAAQSHVRVSFDIPEYTSDITGLGTVRILEAIRETRLKTKFYQAGSS